jgi:hypothetical protein
MSDQRNRRSAAIVHLLPPLDSDQHGTARAETVDDVQAIEQTDGHLNLYGGEGRIVAIFAPGFWAHARLHHFPPATETPPTV